MCRSREAATESKPKIGMTRRLVPTDRVDELKPWWYCKPAASVVLVIWQETIAVPLKLTY